MTQTEKAKAAYASHPNYTNVRAMYGPQYATSKYIRGDNTLENAQYLGYLDATTLYPDFRPITFAEVVAEVLAGTAKRPYAERR